MKKSDIGLVGLAVMGENLAINLESKGYRVSLYNRLHPHTPQAVDRFLASQDEGKAFCPTYSLQELVDSLERPRKILLMIRAGEPVDETLAALQPLLEKGDIVIDGGNSHYLDTRRRQKALREAGIYLVGCGISGGEEGALHGPSIMPSGDEAVAGTILPMLQAIAAHLDDGTPCCAWIGPDSSGLLVKTIHNGIEYGDMQLIAEIYSLLKIKLHNDHEAMAHTFEVWNQGVLESYLTGITPTILRYRDSDGQYLLDRIADRARQKGTGKWSVEAALDSATPLEVTTQAVFARFLSAREQERARMHRLYPNADLSPIDELDTDELHHALYAAKIMAYAQGFDLLYQISCLNDWHLDLSTLATIWRKGCIIRSRFLREIATVYRQTGSYEPLLFTPYFREKISLCLPSWRKVTSAALRSGVAVPALAAALTAFDSWRCAQSPANLIQAQRDYFGAHLYERTDAPEGVLFHTDWDHPANAPHPSQPAPEQ